MKIYQEVYSDYDFDFWSGAVDTVNYLEHDEIVQIFEMLEDCYPDGMSDTELNDFFWFESDLIAEWLGYSDFEELMHRKEEEEEEE